jgi:hypothetical protein
MYYSSTASDIFWEFVITTLLLSAPPSHRHLAVYLHRIRVHGLGGSARAIIAVAAAETIAGRVAPVASASGCGFLIVSNSTFPIFIFRICIFIILFFITNTLITFFISSFVVRF